MKKDLQRHLFTRYSDNTTANYMNSILNKNEYFQNCYRI